MKCFLPDCQVDHSPQQLHEFTMTALLGIADLLRHESFYEVRTAIAMTRPSEKFTTEMQDSELALLEVASSLVRAVDHASSVYASTVIDQEWASINRAGGER